MPVEHKHVYDNERTGQGANTVITTPGYVHISQYGSLNSLIGHDERVIYDSIQFLWFSSNFRLWPSVSADGGIIGDKIMLKSVSFDIRVKLNLSSIFNPNDTSDINTTGNYNDALSSNFRWGDTFIDNFQVGTAYNDSWRRDYRLMIVHFDDEDVLSGNDLNMRTNVANWFNTIYVPLEYNSNNQSTNGTVCMSNKADVKRESTIYTGKYKIIKDVSFSLTPKHNYEHITFSLDPHRELNFKPNPVASTDPWSGSMIATNDWYLNTAMFLIKPSNYDTDMDALSCWGFKQLAATVYRDEADIQRNIKYTYYDI